MWRTRASGLLVVLLGLILLRVGQEGYRWWAYADERDQLRELTARLEEVGFEVVWTQLAADTLRQRIEEADSMLRSARVRVDGYERRAERGTLPTHLYEGYRSELDAYNREARGRNAGVRRWEEVVVRNHAAVTRYNALADSIRTVAAAIGEPYYPVPTPLEVAARRGLVPARAPVVTAAPASREPPS